MKATLNTGDKVTLPGYEGFHAVLGVRINPENILVDVMHPATGDVVGYNEEIWTDWGFRWERK